MNLGLKDKVVVVTGGSKGIGKGICRLLAVEGAIPVIVGRNQSSINSAVKEIKDDGGRVFSAIAELTDPNQCKSAVTNIIEEFGAIHALVNNAGVNDGVGLEKGGYDEFLESLKRNVVHYYMMAHYSLPFLKKSRGVIVNIGSKVSETGQGNTSGYAAANGGRNSLTREWAIELLPYGIRVNCVIVAECFTPLYEKWINSFEDPASKLDEITRNIPFEQRMTTTQEIANTVVFLISERSSHTTGQLIHVDGGYTHLDRALPKY